MQAFRRSEFKGCVGCGCITVLQPLECLQVSTVLYMLIWILGDQVDIRSLDTAIVVLLCVGSFLWCMFCADVVYLL